MNNCIKCGAPLLTDSKFCTQCGSAINVSGKQICYKCKGEVLEGQIFCNNCGARLLLSADVDVGKDSRMRTLVIARDTQVQCLANTYKVIVNGNLLGNIPVGGRLTTTIDSEEVTIEIICTTIMVNARRRLILRLGENPYVSFKVQWPGAIVEKVYDAEVMERS